MQSESLEKYGQLLNFAKFNNLFCDVESSFKPYLNSTSGIDFRLINILDLSMSV